MSNQYELDTEDLLEDFHRVKEEVGGVPTTTEYVELGNYALENYIDRFGSWKDVIEFMGYDYDKYLKRDDTRLRHLKKVELDKQDIIEDYKSVYQEVDGLPTHRAINRHGKYSVHTYLKYFNSLEDIIEEVGYDMSNYPNYRVKNVSKEDLIEDIKRVCNEIGNIPTTSEIQEEGAYSIATYDNYFEKWEDAIQAAGLSLDDYRDRDRVPSHDIPLKEDDIVTGVGIYYLTTGDVPTPDDFVSVYDINLRHTITQKQWEEVIEMTSQYIHKRSEDIRSD